MANQASAANDLDLLTRLNADYITSVQKGDVKRFDEILADDFLCSMADGSLIDRKRFLEVTAQPVTIRNLQAHDVNIRLMGDMAIVHAATSFTAADGRPLPAVIPMSGRGAVGSGSRYRARHGSIERTVAVSRGVRTCCDASSAGPGVGKSTLVRQLADLYHNGSYGEGEKGVWDPRVLEDIADGVNAVGVTEYFARLYDANYRDARDHDGPGKVIFFEGARITLEAHMAEYPPEEHDALRKVLAIGDTWNPDRVIVLTSSTDTIEKHIRQRNRDHEDVENMVRRFRLIDGEFRRLAAHLSQYRRHQSRQQGISRTAGFGRHHHAGRPADVSRGPLPTSAVASDGTPLAASRAWPSQYPCPCNL